MFIPYPKKKKEKKARSLTIWEIWNEENYKSFLMYVYLTSKIKFLDEF
jgi:hypothetical protein